ncbi:hypothetical protein A2801_03940 [Candidatus Woesebacteria bacterium RIFCSPHIGHO2_01_FULL_41_10]|uniref:Succinylglutamate desuccinylase/Aspartoacylase catalytic domain-containing protein n=1 Tax=Candidatus Woesebacteria bacterium RIFCSPHIGHO2_01_FULL_41_10 TaxID=1802500 RepID=A0A1F7YQ31_9BACT|nr:MAG: hypothetical protein A2801_03940 [Candidatus Woesebacteria bacterium RIFCSPHIGHO2_01_FULL_41_10]
MPKLSEKYQFIAGLHGNEPVPIFALLESKTDFVLGNPEALARGKRFIDEDLNKVFGLTGNTVERLRAKKLLEILPTDKPVIDLHTCSAKTEPFCIVIDEKLIPVAQKTGLSKVVVMKFNIKNGHSLLNFRNGISIEVGNHKSQEAYNLTLKILDNLKGESTSPMEVYEVYDTISKTGNYVNFKLYNNEFIPVLAGEKAYPFPGLKARFVKSVT